MPAPVAEPSSTGAASASGEPPARAAGPLDPAASEPEPEPEPESGSGSAAGAAETARPAPVRTEQPSPAPRIDAPADVEAVTGRPVAFTVRAVSPDRPAAQVPALVLGDAPPGATFRDAGDGAREFAWTPPATKAGGETLVTFEAWHDDAPDSRALASTLVRIAEPEPEPEPESESESESESEPERVAEPTGRFGETPPLRVLAARHGVRIGTASPDNVGRDPYTIADGETWRTIVAEEYDILTPENSMKMAKVQPERGRFEWTQADRIVEFAEANSMEVHGHALLWTSSTPAWAGALGGAEHRDEIRTVMREHIAAVVSRYRGRVAVWDVVNEALEEDGTLRHGAWHNGVGPDYIGEAFRLAREHDPDAALIYNDYGIELPGPKSDALLELLRAELTAGTPIDGVGFQMHLYSKHEGRSDEIAANLARFAELGLSIWITEFDVVPTWQLGAVAAAERQADLYADALRTCASSSRPARRSRRGACRIATRGAATPAPCRSTRSSSRSPRSARCSARCATPRRFRAADAPLHGEGYRAEPIRVGRGHPTRTGASIAAGDVRDGRASRGASRAARRRARRRSRPATARRAAARRGAGTATAPCAASGCSSRRA